MRAGIRAHAWQARPRTAGRLVRLLAMLGVLGWRVFCLTTLNRIKPDLDAPVVLAEMATGFLDRLVPDPAGRSRSAGKSSRHRIEIAVLVGILTRAKDPPPGGTVMWRGLGRLSDIVLGPTQEISDAGNRESVPGW